MNSLSENCQDIVCLKVRRDAKLAVGEKLFQQLSTVISLFPSLRRQLGDPSSTFANPKLLRAVRSTGLLDAIRV